MVGQTIPHNRVLGKRDGSGTGVVHGGEDTKLRRPEALRFLRRSFSDRSTLPANRLDGILISMPPPAARGRDSGRGRRVGLPRSRNGILTALAVRYVLQRQNRTA